MQQHNRFAHLMLALEQRSAGFPGDVQRQFVRGPTAAQAGWARAASRLALAMSAVSAVALYINRSPVAGSMIEYIGPEAFTQSPLKTHSDSITWDSSWLLDADI
jgi:hypothetical protein